MTRRVIVVGGGASGMMAAGRSAECGANVLLLEKTPRLGNKLRLTGKGRCNVTNVAEFDDFVAHFRRTGPFLYGSFSKFFVHDLIGFFAARGVPTSVERGGRVFPVSNDARQVAAALEGYMLASGVLVRRRCQAQGLLVESGRVVGVRAGGCDMRGTAVVLATGGASYPRTGSTGDGYRLAAEVGHSIVPVRPALVPLVTHEPWVYQLQGLTLRNVQATLYLDGRRVRQEFGDMLFTHFGLSGPIILTMSGQAVDALGTCSVCLSINLKPNMTSAELDQRLQREFASHGRKHLQSVLAGLLPHKLIAVFLGLAGVAPAKVGSEITAEERRRVTALLQDLHLTVVGSRPVTEAIITAGGIDTVEIEPRTMESRLVRGLFFCGEVIDVDADTGGYNLQAAFSTGYVAGESAAAAATRL